MTTDEPWHEREYRVCAPGSNRIRAKARRVASRKGNKRKRSQQREQLQKEKDNECR